MKNLLIIVIILLLPGCKTQNEYFEKCELGKQLFEYPPTIPICIDTINNYKQFKEKTKSVSDTLSECSIVYGFIYDYKNFYCTPSCSSKRNLVIPSFEIISDGCRLKRVRPILNIYITKPDTIEFITKRESFLNDTILIANDLISTKMRISGNEENIKKYINEFYLDWFRSSWLSSSIPWLHLCINEDYPFNDTFITILNDLISSYYTNTNSSIEAKYNCSLCDLDSTNFTIIKEEFGFRLLVDNFDDRFRIE